MLPDNFFTQLMLNEGVESDDKADSGGHTIFGISQNNFPNAFANVYNLFKSGNIQEAKQRALSFYTAEFWNPLYERINKPNVAFRLFDFGVNGGEKESVNILQETLSISNDGVFGNDTLTAVNNADDTLYENYCQSLQDHYEKIVKNNPNDAKYLQGWLNRLKKLPAA